MHTIPIRPSLWCIFPYIWIFHFHRSDYSLYNACDHLEDYFILSDIFFHHAYHTQECRDSHQDQSQDP
jgi:hypothetical protein